MSLRLCSCETGRVVSRGRSHEPFTLQSQVKIFSHLHCLCKSDQTCYECHVHIWLNTRPVQASSLTAMSQPTWEEVGILAAWCHAARQQPLPHRQQDKGDDYGLQEPMRGEHAGIHPWYDLPGGSGGLALVPSKLSLKHPFFSIAFSGFRYSSVFTMLALLGCSNSYLACHYCIHLTLIFVW